MFFILDQMNHKNARSIKEQDCVLTTVYMILPNLLKKNPDKSCFEMRYVIAGR